ncbi:sulfurtransferase complex subunit TusB [Basfia succiniciproducens]|uniref:DsrH protein n=1 Tax=Mannheimia succiniciproducens (strain KCTC 0769BP / MBEL55E) TaxID=221988 RepID=Q65W92_MANSM|nr:sulfurtransferase complex subunit TusB [[Mannheimia] succiniciproducens]AAU36768.1 unknown [[Mannheimia] succiniciproducens MBEL55E]
MLYTFSKADYAPRELADLLARLTTQDAVLLWQDGVLLALKYGDYFVKHSSQVYLFEPDIRARGLSALIQQKNKSFNRIQMPQLVQLTTRYFPQLAL